jgi:hypothetical protein
LGHDAGAGGGCLVGQRQGAAEIRAPGRGADHSEIAAMGNFTSGKRTLSVGFQFGTVTGGLNCVMYNVMGDDVAMVKDMLIKKYGQTKEKSFGSGYFMTWKTPEPIEFAVGEHPLAAAVSHCKVGA